MSHISENSFRLKRENIQITDLDGLDGHQHTDATVSLFAFPFGRTDCDAGQSSDGYKKISEFCSTLSSNSVVCILTTPPDAARILPFLENCLQFKLWIAIKVSSETYPQQHGTLPESHAALLVLTRYQSSLRHTKTRVQYTYCAACGKTTKDYGGKKHTYHTEGTLLSDVWRDCVYSPFENIDPIISRLQDLFGLEEYSVLRVFDLRSCPVFAVNENRQQAAIIAQTNEAQNKTQLPTSTLLNEDCLTALATIPDNSIDFCFADPPYNLKKKYSHWTDAMELTEYFAWCDQWLGELVRVLKPGGTLAVLNIPLWAVRHYQYLCSQPNLSFENWIVWDAMSFPVRLIMPAHYTILCFSKGQPRSLPIPNVANADTTALNDSFCSRDTCIARRRKVGISDRIGLSDMWYDVHRLKHNSQRVDHPCQLPPLLMRRLYTLFTRPGEHVLDCFNGAGTSTLVAQQMERQYIGIELSPEYHALTQQRHKQLSRGEDPFGKTATVPKAKNSRVERLPKQHYSVSKKILQLDVKRIAQQIGRIPSREEVRNMSIHNIEYFDNYFSSWGEVCAAARTTGMTELQAGREEQTVQLSLDFDTVLN